MIKNEHSLFSTILMCGFRTGHWHTDKTRWEDLKAKKKNI